MIFNWSFQIISHIGIETRLGLPQEATMGNLDQWTKARSNNIA